MCSVFTLVGAFFLWYMTNINFRLSHNASVTCISVIIDCVHKLPTIQTIQIGPNVGGGSSYLKCNDIKLKIKSP